ncbi:hypothetical protein CYMTET_42100 [Cymbomonas tetramitiformis]|uniref:Uncharacterized protein n=1 Tax=Cymbomonas tetramitiformis TaxID=36881 RepID=A0AAE0C643_9CHLO|nr:hypothetical protein CYMTET_42100 [Cymbomonas tetramitiformis]
MACEECDMDAADKNYEIVSAFQIAFDSGDDTAFARLCAQSRGAGFPPSAQAGCRWCWRRTALSDATPRLSAATVEGDAVKHDTVEIAERDTSEIDMPFPKQLADTEPPFAKSFMDNVSVSLGFTEDSKVSMHSSPLTIPYFISPANDLAVDVINLESDSESDIEDEDGPIRYDTLPPPALRVGGVKLQRGGIGGFLTAADVPALFVRLSRMCLIGVTAGSALGCDIATPLMVSDHGFWQSDTAAYDTLDFVIDNNFTLISGILDSYNMDISDLDFEIENYNAYTFCEVCPADHFQSG